MNKLTQEMPLSMSIKPPSATHAESRKAAGAAQEKTASQDTAAPSSIAVGITALFKGLEKTLTLLMVLALVAMIVLVFVNVVLRYGFNSGISISVELSRFLFVWVTFMGAVTALIRQEHLSVNTFADKLPAAMRAGLDRLVTLAMLGCCLMLLKGSYAQTVLNWSNLSPISGIPVGVFYLAGLMAGVLMSLILLWRLLTPLALHAVTPRVAPSHASDSQGDTP
ncbi:TRAP transporter small permease [Cobetia amphilecti]|uniref:TRAP transporter small permease n=1 Tax=Cobetia amphilecti TaxID=1055104 RepID=UPI001C084C63|nr:TRAP transporter small permease [Cobetia amphilecti]MBU3007681.1 TRAP transporter small permease [Cobetia amphilecti]